MAGSKNSAEQQGAAGTHLPATLEGTRSVNPDPLRLPVLALVVSAAAQERSKEQEARRSLGLHPVFTEIFIIF